MIRSRISSILADQGIPTVLVSIYENAYPLAIHISLPKFFPLLGILMAKLGLILTPPYPFINYN
jgi:hypothetical protein